MLQRRARPPAVGTTAQPYTAGRLPFFVIAVRKSASEVPLRFIDALRFAPDIVRSQPRTASLLSGNSEPRTASLLSGNSVLRAVFGSGRPTRRCWLLCFNDSASGGREESPPRSSPAARAKRTAADNKPASTCSGLQICVNLQSCPVCPSTVFSGARLIRAYLCCN